MTNTKHTPGPWVVKHSGMGDATVIANNGWVNKDGSLFEPTIVPRIDFPTAHLIAAAPAMYEALQALVEYLDTQVQAGKLDDWKHVLVARQALAQAEGK